MNLTNEEIENKYAKPFEWFTIATILVSTVALFLVCEQRDTLKAEAVKRGAAEWIINPDNGETTFQWKEKP